MSTNLKKLGIYAQAPFNHQIFHYRLFPYPQRLSPLWIINITLGTKFHSRNLYIFK